ncbi:MAG TPA: NUDIX domain-containing protein [Chloroflexota bacterium]|jgi:ADP-ribose pyrophosphatase YjhB (NUDIX family)|nr:NUDIX domain-containing protein [Chloroflexota bacterium]
MSDRGGSTVAAGAVVLRGDAVLLVRLTYSRQAGRYMLPGGYVDPGETITAAVEREVLEETAVTAAVEGLIGLRARVEDGLSNTYCLFLLRYVAGQPRAHGRENDDARWFDIAELEGPGRAMVVPLAHAAAVAVLRGNVKVIPAQPPDAWPTHTPKDWVVLL